MTNEQLAVLLTSHRKQLLRIFMGLREELENKDLDYHLRRGKWIGEGEEPPITLPGLVDPDYERINGDPVVLDNLSSFLLSVHRIVIHEAG